MYKDMGHPSHLFAGLLVDFGEVGNAGEKALGVLCGRAGSRRAGRVRHSQGVALR